MLSALAVVAGALFAAGIAVDALTIRRGLTTAEARVESARASVLQGDVPAAADALEGARAALADPLARTHRPLWRAGERLPVLGDTLATVTALVDTVDAATGLGRTLLTSATELVGADAQLTITATNGRVDLSPVQATRTALVDLDLGRLDAATARLRAAVPGPAPSEVADARGRVLDLADRTLRETAAARDLVDLLPTFLGGEGQRRYLLALQNPAEVRGTGGLIGFYAVVTAEGGKFSLSRPDPFEVLDQVEGRRTTEPVAAPGEFTARYAQTNAAGFLANTNVDPDLPTVAPILLDLYRQRTGQTLDGVIAIDPLGLEAILREVGPVDLPADHVVDGLPSPVPPDQIAETLMVRAYEALGGDTPEREEYLRAFTVAAFERLFDGAWDALAVTPAVARTAADGHLQLFSRRTDEQAAFQQLRIAGALAPASPAHDLLGVTANNAAGNKADVYAALAVSGLVQLVDSEEGAVRVADLTVTLRNGLPLDGLDDYFLQSAALGRGFRDGFDGPRGLNRTWFSVWMPATSVPTGLLVDGEETEATHSAIHDRRAVDHVLEVPASDTRTFTTTVTGPVAVERDGDARIYRLTLHRQPKAIPDRLRLLVTPMAGYEAVEVELSGGGTGDGFGAHGEPGPPLTATLDGGDVVLEGDVTRTVDVTIRMAPTG